MEQTNDCVYVNKLINFLSISDIGSYLSWKQKLSVQLKSMSFMELLQTAHKSMEIEASSLKITFFLVFIAAHSAVRWRSKFQRENLNGSYSIIQKIQIHPDAFPSFRANGIDFIHSLYVHMHVPKNWNVSILLCVFFSLGQITTTKFIYLSYCTNIEQFHTDTWEPLIANEKLCKQTNEYERRSSCLTSY